jgi:hypothetical protein
MVRLLMVKRTRGPAFTTSMRYGLEAYFGSRRQRRGPAHPRSTTTAQQSGCPGRSGG